MPSKRICSVAGCGNKMIARGMCRAHYSTWWRRNADETTKYPPAIERWRDRYIVEPNGCWRWTGTFGSQGYGQISDSGKKHHAHRFGYIFFKNDPGDAVLDHLCRNRWCVNPDHLEPVTIAENFRRGDTTHLGRALRERTVCVNGHPLTEDNVYRTKDGFRKCRACMRTRALKSYYAKRQAR